MATRTQDKVEKTSKASSSAPDKVTPMMEQYFGLKERAGDCLLFYRMGDFFELFYEDAKLAAAALDIALTSRGKNGGDVIPMCGVPVHSAEGYLAKLIRAGFKVAIAEQVETPAEAKARGGYKALVARDIIRYVTAGTLTEDNLLDARSDNMLVALAEVQGEIGLAAADISTGNFEMATIADDALDAELARLAPSEIICPPSLLPRLAKATFRQYASRQAFARAFRGGDARWHGRIFACRAGQRRRADRLCRSCVPGPRSLSASAKKTGDAGISLDRRADPGKPGDRPNAGWRTGGQPAPCH